MWSATITPEGDHSVVQDVSYNAPYRRGRGRGRGGRGWRGNKRPYSGNRRERNYPPIVRPIFDWSEMDEYFPPAMQEIDYSLLAQLLQKQVQDISPSLEEQSAVQSFSSKVVTVIENMILTGEGEEMLLEEVRAVGSYKKGTALAGCFTADVVVMFRELPTVELVEMLAEKVSSVIDEAEKDQDNESWQKVQVLMGGIMFDLLYRVGQVTVTVRVFTTSTGRVIYGQPSEEIPEFKAFSDSLRMIRHVRWFEEETGHLKNVRSLVRILKNMRKHVPGLASLNVWYIELLSHCAVMPLYSNESLSLVDSFRRVFQLLSAGLFLPGSVGLPDPCEEGENAIHENLRPEECDQLARNAQMILVMLQFGAYREVLGCEGATPTDFSQPYSFGGITLSVPPPAYMTELMLDPSAAMTTT